MMITVCRAALREARPVHCRHCTVMQTGALQSPLTAAEEGFKMTAAVVHSVCCIVWIVCSRPGRANDLNLQVRHLPPGPGLTYGVWSHQAVTELAGESGESERQEADGAPAPVQDSECPIMSGYD